MRHQINLHFPVSATHYLRAGFRPNACGAPFAAWGCRTASPGAASPFEDPSRTENEPMEAAALSFAHSRRHCLVRRSRQIISLYIYIYMCVCIYIYIYILLDWVYLLVVVSSTGAAGTLKDTSWVENKAVEAAHSRRHCFVRRHTLLRIVFTC